MSLYRSLPLTLLALLFRFPGCPTGFLWRLIRNLNFKLPTIHPLLALRPALLLSIAPRLALRSNWPCRVPEPPLLRQPRLRTWPRVTRSLSIGTPALVRSLAITSTVRTSRVDLIVLSPTQQSVL